MGNFREVEFAFDRTMNLAGGPNEYGDSSKSAILAEISINKEIQTLAVRYLVCESHRAKHNLEQLDAKLIETFSIGVRA